MTNRRAVLAGVAALPTAGVPSLTIASPDAELISLGERVKTLHVMLDDAIRRAEPNHAAWQEELKRFSTSIPNPNAAYFEAAAKIDREYPVASPTPDQVSDMMYKPSCRIMELPAHTIDGLKAKATLVRLELSECWEKSKENADWHDLLVRSLVDSILEAKAKPSSASL